MRPMDSGLIGLARERCDLPVTRPKLHVVLVDELPRALLGRLIVGTNKLDSPQEVAVLADNVDSIAGHLLAGSWCAILHRPGSVDCSQVYSVPEKEQRNQLRLIPL